MMIVFAVGSWDLGGGGETLAAMNEVRKCLLAEAEKCQTT